MTPYLTYLGAPKIKILQSCNGLLLCSEPPNSRFVQRFYVCNPTTTKFKTIHYPYPYPFRHAPYVVYLAFDPSHSLHFKLVCIVASIELDIYDSQTNTWSTSPINLEPPETTFFDAAVFCRRAIHWYSYEQTSKYFDVDKECFNSMPMPHSLNNGIIHYFGESRGHLCLILSSALTSFEEFDEEFSQWSFTYHMNLDYLRAAFCCRYQIPSHRFEAWILSVVPGANKEEPEVVLLMFGMLVSYNLKNGTLKKLMGLVPCQEVSVHNLKCHWYNVFPFIQTLSPV